MMKKKTAKQRLEKELLENPKTAQVIREAKDQERHEEAKTSQADHFTEVGKVIKGLKDAISERMLLLSVKTSEGCDQISKRLGQAIKVLDDIERKDDMVKALTDVKEVLDELNKKETIVNVAAPIVEVPEPKIIDETKIIPETKHTEASNQILMKILSYTMKQQGEGVRIKNKEPSDAIPVVLTDKTKKAFYNAVTAAISSGAGLPFLNPSSARVPAKVTSDGKQLVSEGGLSGASTDGTRALAVANTWYQVPNTIPTEDYVLVVSKENKAGIIRWSFDSSGAPSTTNGLRLVSNAIIINLAGGEAVYFGSDVAGDDVNWTTKII